VRVFVLLGLAVSAPAMAADLRVKPAAPPTADWTGPYAGIALGAKFAETTWTTTSTSDLPGTIVDASSPARFRPAVFRAGGYGGYNWQSGSYVYGLELDVAYADGKTTHAGLPGCAIECFPGAPGPGVDTSSVKLGWDASARARLGYLVAPDALLFVTGGVAWQSIEADGLCQHSASDPQCTVSPATPFDAQSERKTLTGWTAGLGFERRLSANWLLRAEYRYADFGKFNGVFAFHAPGAPLGADTNRFNLAVETHTATLGLTYRFGALPR
jgi:outer membrane immunogenic protein